MCSKGGRGFGGQAGVRTSSNGLSEEAWARQADGSGRDTQADRQSRALRSRSSAVGGGGSGGRTRAPGWMMGFTWWNRRRVDERGSRGEQEAVEQGGPAEDKRLQIEDKAHDLEGLRPGQGTGPLARMGLDRWKRCDWPGRLCVC